MDQSDTKIDLIKYMQVNYLYFVMQWFCLISWLSAVNYFDKLNNGAGNENDIASFKNQDLVISNQ